MSAFWAGLLVGILSPLAWLVVAVLSNLASRAVNQGSKVTAFAMKRDAPLANRSAAAAVVYAADSMRMLTTRSDFAFIVMRGMDEQRRRQAADLLQPKASLRRPRPVDNPGPRENATEETR